MKILITGGAGYIGSTISYALSDAGHQPVVLDSLLAGRSDQASRYPFVQGDVGDPDVIRGVVRKHPDIECTIHCAALKVVGESVDDPHRYYQVNLVNSLNLFRTLAELGKTNVVFSSSASIYAPTENGVVTEDSPLAPNSPYARTKVMAESALQDYCRAYNMRGLSLRYVNPIGADPRLRTGADLAKSGHALGLIIESALGKRDSFTIAGTDWPTKDGTGVRDYIHLWDLARAHLSAVEHIEQAIERGEHKPINIGTGRGVTVRELVQAVRNVVGRDFPVLEGPRRAGDHAGGYADSERAARLLGWRAELSLEDGIRSTLEWVRAQKNLPAIPRSEVGPDVGSSSLSADVG